MSKHNKYSFTSQRNYTAIRMQRDTAEQARANAAYGGSCYYCSEYSPLAATLPGGRGALCCPPCWVSMDIAEEEAYEAEQSQERR